MPQDISTLKTSRLAEIEPYLLKLEKGPDGKDKPFGPTLKDGKSEHFASDKVILLRMQLDLILEYRKEYYLDPEGSIFKKDGKITIADKDGNLIKLYSGDMNRDADYDAQLIDVIKGLQKDVTYLDKNKKATFEIPRTGRVTTATLASLNGILKTIEKDNPEAFNAFADRVEALYSSKAAGPKAEVGNAPGAKPEVKLPSTPRDVDPQILAEAARAVVDPSLLPKGKEPVIRHLYEKNQKDHDVLHPDTKVLGNNDSVILPDGVKAIKVIGANEPVDKDANKDSTTRGIYGAKDEFKLSDEEKNRKGFRDIALADELERMKKAAPYEKAALDKEINDAAVRRKAEADEFDKQTTQLRVAAAAAAVSAAANPPKKIEPSVKVIGPEVTLNADPDSTKRGVYGDKDKFKLSPEEQIKKDASATQLEKDVELAKISKELDDSYAKKFYENAKALNAVDAKLEHLKHEQLESEKAAAAAKPKPVVQPAQDVYGPGVNLHAVLAAAKSRENAAKGDPTVYVWHPENEGAAKAETRASAPPKKTLTNDDFAQGKEVSHADPLTPSPTGNKASKGRGGQGTPG